MQHNKSVSRSATLKKEIGIQPPNTECLFFFGNDAKNSWL